MYFREIVKLPKLNITLGVKYENVNKIIQSTDNPLSNFYENRIILLYTTTYLKMYCLTSCAMFLRHSI